MEFIPMYYRSLTINYNSRHQTNKIHKLVPSVIIFDVHGYVHRNTITKITNNMHYID